MAGRSGGPGLEAVGLRQSLERHGPDAIDCP